ncbi:BTAD domain-containing putative transcriptional regulator [Streptomyces sp. NPDC088747]|uniref:AfsR/SARP family transcriptional regulator n=1 Tax=Streptomyces sp. NPDC088747 TaxID=3365886 RepID=UPI00380A5A0F
MSDDSASLRVHVLGPLGAWLEERSVDLGPPRQQAVFASLALSEGRRLPAPDLVRDVWGPHPPLGSQGTLRTYLSHLRTAFRSVSTQQAAVAIDAVNGSYVLHVTTPTGRPEMVSDGWQFEHAGARVEGLCNTRSWDAVLHESSQALAHWQGTPLTRVPGPAAAAVRSRLEEQHLVLREHQLEARIRLEQHHDAIPDLTAIAHTHPDRLRAQLLLLEALNACGRLAEALTLYARTTAKFRGDAAQHQLQSLYTRLLARPRVRATSSLDVPTATASARPAASSGTAPVHLPPAVAYFVDRQLDTERLETALTSPLSRTTVTLVAGMAGMGTSTAALNTAHQLKRHFPGGIYYADLRQTPRPNLTLGELAGRLLRALGHPKPSHPGASLRALHEHLAQREALLLLDNADHADWVVPLLPLAEACRLLVAGRTTLPGWTAERHLLNSLTTQAAHNLLTAIVGAHRIEEDPAATAQLISLCAGLPQALQMVAVTLATRPQWSPAALAGRLKGGTGLLRGLRTEHHSLHAILADSELAVSAEHRRTLRILAGIPQPAFTTQEAAASLKMTVARASRHCEALAAACLLHPLAPHRYGMHPLLRLYAATSEKVQVT